MKPAKLFLYTVIITISIIISVISNASIPDRGYRSATTVGSPCQVQNIIINECLADYTGPQCSILINGVAHFLWGDIIEDGTGCINPLRRRL